MTTQNCRQWTALALFAFFLASCGARQEKATSTDSTSEMTAPSSAPLEDRSVIRNADLELKVASVEQEVSNIQQLSNHLLGHVHHYEIKNIPTDVHEIVTHIDSVTLQQIYQPEAMLQVQIPAKAADTFIQTMLDRHVVIEQFLYDEKDITPELDDQEVTSTMSSDAVQNAYAKNVVKNLAYKSRYLWFNIHMKGDAVYTYAIQPRPHATDGAIGVRAKIALQSGWSWCMKAIVALLYLWPLWCFIAVLKWLLQGKKYKSLFHRAWGKSQEAVSTNS